jgi:hypothetical protein
LPYLRRQGRPGVCHVIQSIAFPQFY